MEKLTGKIEDITFYSSETGFMVFVLEHDENKYSTCVGSLPELAVGERVVLTGDWTTHKVYGEQFKVQHYEIEIPTTLEDIEKLDEIISSNLKGGWRISRISKVSLAILRLAICEMTKFADIPVSVSINEAVELAKTYAAEEDSAFVNGLLSSVSKGLTADV